MIDQRDSLEQMEDNTIKPVTKEDNKDIRFRLDRIKGFVNSQILTNREKVLLIKEIVNIYDWQDYYDY